MNRRRIPVIAGIMTLVVAIAFSIAPDLAIAQGGGGLGIPLEPLSDPQLPFTPSESAIQTLNTDSDFSAYADRITKAVSGNTVMLKTITNTVEACLTKMLTADKAGVAACADFVEAQNKAFSTFLKENQDLSNQILYGG